MQRTSSDCRCSTLLLNHQILMVCPQLGNIFSRLEVWWCNLEKCKCAREVWKQAVADPGCITPAISGEHSSCLAYAERGHAYARAHTHTRAHAHPIAVTVEYLFLSWWTDFVCVSLSSGCAYIRVCVSLLLFACLCAMKQLVPGLESRPPTPPAGLYSPPYPWLCPTSCSMGKKKKKEKDVSARGLHRRWERAELCLFVCLSSLPDGVLSIDHKKMSRKSA